MPPLIAAGAYFGERAASFDEPRQVEIRAMTEVRVVGSSERLSTRSEVTMDFMRNSLWIGVLSSCLMLACAKGPSLEEIRRTNNAIAADVKSEVGREALMTYSQDGSRTKVVVTLLSTTSTDAAQLGPKIEVIVKRHYPKITEIAVQAQPE